MSLEQTTELYASVLRQLLPEDVYDTAEMTHVADDIYAHAKALAQADIDAHRLLQVLETIPVDLLADYEREYGLPMQCMVPGSQTFEERISVLRWIRQHRNVMNREYLEQILAIFGVTFVDVVKHYPMQCTAPCTAPVNTERLRYKVLLRLQYPMTADMSCIIENYLPCYLRVEWVVDMPWGKWIVNPDVTVNTAGIVHYTAYKTNQREYYDSYADMDLSDAIIRSFNDEDMQQWQGFVNAVYELTGVSDWVLDPANNRITYYPPEQPDPSLYEYRYGVAGFPTGPDSYFSLTRQGICSQVVGVTLYTHWSDYTWTYVPDYGYYGGCKSSLTVISIARFVNPAYDPAAEKEEKTFPLDIVSQKIISNAVSHENEVTQMLAETYIQAVANSIFNSDELKKFVKLSDLLSPLELNKTLRT